MPRQTLDATRLHPAIRDKVVNLNADIVVVGMAGNPFCRRARRALEGAGVPHQYLEYGSYFSQWRQRNSLKMWSGWPTFPMVFVKGNLVGGADELAALVRSGELKRLLGE